MINSRGIIQNNATTSDFIRKQRKLNGTYKILDKEEEREMIGRYARLKLGPDGNPIYRTKPSAPDKRDDFECEFEWIGDERELREKLVMHNLQAVSRIATKHCQDTRDFDEMYARGLYGLSRAANEFHPFKLITKTVGHEIAEDGRKVPVKEVVRDDEGNLGFIKFNTFAQFWIFKYVMDEFYSKSIQIDNNSASMNELVRIHNAESRGITLENYLQANIAPEIQPKKELIDEVSAHEATGIYDSIRNYIKTTDDMTETEKRILEETFYKDEGYLKKDGTPNVKKLSTLLKIPQQEVLSGQMSAFSKLKDFLYEEYGVSSLSDVM